MAVAASRVAELPIFRRRRGPAEGSDCERTACAGARCAASRAADYRGPLHVVVRACRPRRDDVPSRAVPTCPRAPVPACPRARAVVARRVVRPSPSSASSLSSASSPSLAFLVLTLFLPSSYLVLTREGAFAPSFVWPLTILDTAGWHGMALSTHPVWLAPATGNSTTGRAYWFCLSAFFAFGLMLFGDGLACLPVLYQF